MNVRVLEKKRPGLTLMELIVVLMILVAIAGILIPMFPSMLTRAHVAAHTSNVTEATKVILSYQALNNGFPDQWDSLTDGKALIDYLAGGSLDPQPPPAGGQAGGTITASVPSAAELGALNSAGINTVHNMVPKATAGATGWDGNPFDPTFNNYSAPPTPPTTIAAGTSLAFIDPAANGTALTFIQSQYPSWSTTARYVVLGLGPRCTVVGKGAITAPVHFGDTPSVTPDHGYGRFVAIFKVSDTTKVLNMAQLVGVAAIHDVGPTNLDGEFQNWYQLNNGGS
jgi:type II secretory pathway pseudopilin PulG